MILDLDEYSEQLRHELEMKTEEVLILTEEATTLKRQLTQTEKQMEELLNAPTGVPFHEWNEERKLMQV